MKTQGKAQQIGEISRMGGWRGHPNSIAALLRCQVPRRDQRKCIRCGDLAMRASQFCRHHAGAVRLRDLPGRPESRLLARLERCGLLPFELLAHPAWRGLAGARRGQRAPLRLALLQAWDKRLVEPLHWVQTQRLAREAGRAHPMPEGWPAWREVK